MEKLTPNQRKRLVDALVHNDLEYNADDTDFLRDILRDGFGGYANLDDDELIKACEEISIDVADTMSTQGEP
jgi:hypothetical protein